MTIAQLARKWDIRAQRKMWRRFRRVPRLYVWLLTIAAVEVVGMLLLGSGIGDGRIW